MLSYINREGPIITLLAWLLVLGVIYLSSMKLQRLVRRFCLHDKRVLHYDGRQHRIRRKNKLPELHRDSAFQWESALIDHVNFHSRFYLMEVKAVSEKCCAQPAGAISDWPA
jgi:hypothetical protein